MAERNLFSLGRALGKEDQLTEYFAWLIETVAEVGVALVDLSLEGAASSTAGEIQITTQRIIPGRRLDAVLETDSALIVIESKLDSSYGQQQLEDYVKWLAASSTDEQERVLLTLTKHPAPWPETAIELASKMGVRASPARWADVHALLGELAGRETLPDIAAQLIREFRDLLSEEGLVPMAALNNSELDTRWGDATKTIERFHAYFRASEKTLTDALGAPTVGRGSFKPDQVYKTFWLDGVESGLAVGLHAAGSRMIQDSADPHREAPMLFATFWANAWKEPASFASITDHLDRTVPEGWLRAKRMSSCPCIVRYLDDTLRDTSFEEQQLNLANAVAPLRLWVATAASAFPPPKRKRRLR